MWYCWIYLTHNPRSEGALCVLNINSLRRNDGRCAKVVKRGDPEVSTPSWLWSIGTMGSRKRTVWNECVPHRGRLPRTSSRKSCANVQGDWRSRAPNEHLNCCMFSSGERLRTGCGCSSEFSRFKRSPIQGRCLVEACPCRLRTPSDPS